jgi:hypothetical protein
MSSKLFGLVCIWVVIYLISMAVDIKAAQPPDSVKTTQPAFDTTLAYPNVDVTIETDWSDPEKIENVNLEIKYVNDQPVSLHYHDELNEKIDIRIINGMKIKVIDHATKEVIKVFVKEEVKKDLRK